MKRQGKGKGNPPLGSKSKPFCDCPKCRCRECPDVRKIIPLNAKNEKAKCVTITSTENNGQTSHLEEINLMDVIKNKEDCNCEIMAQAVRSDVHMNLNVSEQRARHSKDESK